MYKILTMLIVVLSLSSPVYAGGVAPGEMPAPQPQKKEKVTATPSQTSAAVSKARQASPKVKEERIATPQPEAVSQPETVTTPAPVAKPGAATKAGSSAWMLGNGSGSCAPLSSVANKVNVGSFTSPRDLAQKLRQRGFQAFALDIGDQPDTVYKVRVPGKQLDLTFVRSGMCR